MIFGQIATAVTAVANALMAREHNVLLRMLAENSQQTFEAKKLVYQYENSDVVDTASLQLAKLWLHELDAQKALLFAAAGRTAPAPSNPAGTVQSGAGAGDTKP